MSEIDRSKFIKNAIEYWQNIINPEGTSRGANACERANKKIVAAWEKDGLALDALIPLVSDPSPEIRFAAAAYLIRYSGAREKAIAVLKDMQLNDKTMRSTSAGAVLEFHGAGKMI